MQTKRLTIKPSIQLPISVFSGGQLLNDNLLIVYLNLTHMPQSSRVGHNVRKYLAFVVLVFWAFYSQYGPQMTNKT